MTGPQRPSICFISLAAYHYFNTDADTMGGGAQRQLYLLSQELKSTFDVRFIVGNYGQPKREVREGITLHRTYTPKGDSAPHRQLVRSIKLIDAIRRADADFYLFRGYPHKAGILNLYFESRNIPWLYSLSSDNNLDRHIAKQPAPLPYLFRRALTNVDIVVSQTEYQATQLSKQFGVDSVVIPNGYPPASTARSRNDREFFLWVGNIKEKIKRPHLLLDIAEQVPDSDFVMIGPESPDPEYQKFIVDRADSIENVEYLGPVDPDEIHSYFRRALALINTSLREGFPNTFLEAWRYSTPVLSLDVDTTRYVDFSGPSGFMNGNKAQLVTAIERLSDDREYWRSLSCPAREYFEKNYPIEKVAQQYEEIVFQCLA